MDALDSFYDYEDYQKKGEEEKIVGQMRVILPKKMRWKKMES